MEIICSAASKFHCIVELRNGKQIVCFQFVILCCCRLRRQCRFTFVWHHWFHLSLALSFSHQSALRMVCKLIPHSHRHRHCDMHTTAHAHTWRKTTWNVLLCRSVKFEYNIMIINELSSWGKSTSRLRAEISQCTMHVCFSCWCRVNEYEYRWKLLYNMLKWTNQS